MFRGLRVSVLWRPMREPPKPGCIPYDRASLCAKHLASWTCLAGCGQFDDLLARHVAAPDELVQLYLAALSSAQAHENHIAGPLVANQASLAKEQASATDPSLTANGACVP